MADEFANLSTGLNSPASKADTVTPDDDNDLPNTARGLFIGTGGTVVLIAAGDTTAKTYKNLASGSTLSVRAKRVLATGTTAADILALR